MSDDQELISIEKLKEIFAKASGEKMIEVTSDEYQGLLEEAMKKRLKVTEDDESFKLVLPHVTIKVVCETEEDDDDEDSW